MGFRSRRGHRGHHGQHGHSQHGHGQGFAWTGEANGLQPGDDVGNRKSFKPVIVPPDDLGNRKDPEESTWVPDDDVGNRVDIAPTHEMSGVLLDLDPKKRRRRPKGSAPLEKVGRFFIGGVNPLIAGGQMRALAPPPEAFDAGPDSDDNAGSDDGRPPAQHERHGQHGQHDRHGQQDRQGQQAQQRQRKRFEQVDGHAAHEVHERRAQRFFDFDEDDRFEYALKTPAEQKRAEAGEIVRRIVEEAGRDATVLARLIDDGDRPKVLVTIDDRGPAPSMPPERRAPDAAQPLFVMGSSALMSLNYLVNKVVNRYPDDRIRLAILPAADERLYLDALDEHRRRVRPTNTPTTAAAANAGADASVTAASPTVAAAPTPAPSIAPPVVRDAAAPAPGDTVGTSAATRVEDTAAEAVAPRKPRGRRRSSAPAVDVEQPVVETSAAPQAGASPTSSSSSSSSSSAPEATAPPPAAMKTAAAAPIASAPAEAVDVAPESAPRRGRRAPAEEPALPPLPALDRNADDARRPPLRPRGRRAPPPMVEVVRVGPPPRK